MKTLLTLSTFFASAGMLAAYPGGSRIPVGNAGEPGSGTPCASCHSVTLNPPGGSVKLTLPNSNTFSAGTVQRWILTVADPNTSYRTGFQLTATAGKFTAVSSAVVTSASSGRQYVSQSSPSATYTFDWTPPSDIDAVTVYLAGVAASGTRRTNVYTSTLTLSSASAKPSISAGGVVNAASFAAGISSGAWVTIFGSNFAPAGTARTWQASEIVDGKLPTELEGTKVRINGKYAAIAYISPTQLNVQVPEDTSLGTVSVDVTTSGGTSDAITTDLRTAAPGLFRFTPSNNRYVSAVHADGILAAPSGLFDPSVTVRTPKPGDTLLLYGTGFGPTEPAVPAGISFFGAAPLTTGSNFVVRIGGVPAEVKFAGLSAPGLYQFNVVVPTLPDGDHPVEASVLGQDVPSQQYIAVKQ